MSVHNYVRLKIAYGYMVKLATTLAQLYSCTRTAAPSILQIYSCTTSSSSTAVQVYRTGTRVLDLVLGDRCEVSDMIFLNPSFLMAICTFVRVRRGPLYSKGLWWVQFGGFDDAM